MRTGLISAGHPVNVATGAVFSAHEDFAVPGRIRLVWERRYHTGHLDTPPGRLGPGWSARYFATLTRQTGGYRLVLPEGGSEVFPDPDGTVERGGVVRNLATFQELTRRNDGFVLTRWGPEGQPPERLVFFAHNAAAPMPLLRIENEASAALDLVYDQYGRVHRIQQRLEQRALEVEYGDGGRVAEVTFVAADGTAHLVARYDYDGGGRLVVAVDALGHADRYEYDAANRLVREVRKDGSVFSFQYDRTGRCLRSSGLERYDEKVFRYLDAVRWTEVTDSTGASTRYQWLPSGQVVTVFDALGGVEEMVYDELGRIVAQVLPGGQTTRYVYDEAGNRSETIDPAGQSWKFGFNTRHQRVSFTDPLDRTWRWYYDDTGLLVAVEQPTGARFDYRWDAAGNLREVKTERGTYQRFRHDARGALVESSDASGHITRYTLDPYGRLTEVVNAAGQRRRVAHDVFGRTTLIEYPDRSTEVYVYDAAGNQVAATDRDGHTRRYRWGPCRRLLEATDANGGTVRFVWGTETYLLDEVINEKSERLRFSYDPLGRITKEIWFDGAERSFVYDAAGQVVRMQNGAGETIRFGWDSCGRLVERRLPEGTQRLTWDASGQLLSAEVPERAIEFERDPAGRITREVQGEHVVSTSYDSTGNRTRLWTDLGHAVQFEIDAGLRVERLALSGGDAFDITYNEIGLEATRDLPGGIRLSTEYDVNGRISLQKLADAAGTRVGPRPLVQRSYEYSPRGTVLRLRDSRRGTAEYAYDATQQIGAARRDGRAIESFQYDVAGNLTEIVWQGVPAQLRYTPGNRLERAGETRYEFDGQGRLVRRLEPTENGEAEWRFGWDSLDQLRTVTRPDGKVWRYFYDFFGRRFLKEGPGTRTEYVWNGDVLLHEITTGERPTSWVYVDNGRSPIAKLVGDELLSVVPDQLGTPQELITRKGVIAWAAHSSVWGRDLGHEATATQCLARFPGQWADPESGLHYNRFRYYDPATGRFISQDPIAPGGSVNFYRYAPNPLNWVDPLGLDVCANRQKGEDFKDGVRDQYEAAGWTVHEEVTVAVTVPGTPPTTVRTRVDLVATDPSGTTTHYIETKASATAPYTPNQTTAGVGTPPGTLVGPAEMRSSRDGLPVARGQNLPPGTQVQTVRPGDQVPGLPPGTTADPPP